MSKYFISLFIACLFCSCNYWANQENEKILTSATLLMNDKPDSAYLLLNTLNTKELSEPHYYRFITLKVNVKDKLYLNAKEDTIVFQAMNYFLKKNNAEYKLISCFVSAKIQEEQNNQEKAIMYYLEATKWIDKTSNFLINGDIYYGLSRLLYLMNQYESSLSYLEKGQKYYELANCNYEREIYVNELFAMNYLNLNSLDNSLLFFKLAETIAIQEKDRHIEQRVTLNMAIVYRDAKEFEVAKEKCIRALYLANDSLNTGKLQLILGSVFFEKEQYDSATISLYNAKELIKNTDDIVDLIDLNSLLSKVEAKNKNYELALYYQEISDMYLKARKYAKKASSPILAKYHDKTFQTIRAERDKYAEERLYFYLIFLSLIILFGVFVYRNKAKFRKFKQMFRTIKEKHYKEIAEMEMRLDEKLSAVNKVAKNQLLKVILQMKDIARLRALSDARHVDNKAVSRQVNKIIAQLTFADAYQVYNNTYDGLFDRLKTDLPYLDKIEYRICALSCVGLGTLVVAAILDEMPNTVQKRKTIIRKKIGIGNYGNFQEYIYINYGIEIIEASEED